MSAPFPTLMSQRCDGRAALALVLASSVYGTPAQAVASLAIFTHPDTVAQIPGGGPLFPAVRASKQRRTLGERDGAPVGFDDNETPNHAFRWSNAGMPRWRDVQLNHIWRRSGDPRCFTAPANLCAAPSFLAKLTDHAPIIAALLRRRAFALYGWVPSGEPEPPAPPGYADLVWAEPWPPTPNLEQVLLARLDAEPKSTAARTAREIGWAFSGFAPGRRLKPL